MFRKWAKTHLKYWLDWARKGSRSTWGFFCLKEKSSCRPTWWKHHKKKEIFRNIFLLIVLPWSTPSGRSSWKCQPMPHGLIWWTLRVQSLKAVYRILSHLIYISGLAPGHLFLLGWSHCVVVRTVVVVRRTRWRIVADTGVQQFPDRRVRSRNHSDAINRGFRSDIFFFRL